MTFPANTPTGFLKSWRRERDDTRRLASLSDHQLRDIGLTRNDIGTLATAPHRNAGSW